MKKTLSNAIAKFLRRATLAIACSVLAVSAAYGQGGPCAVSQIRVRIGTAAQNPLVNSLDLEIHFTNGTIHTIQKVPDVNGAATWGISSQNVVTIPLNQTVPVSEIKRIRLIDNVSGGEWDMSFLRARALGSGWNGRIAAWGTDPNPSPHAFTATYPAFGIDTIPNACDFVRRPVEGPVRVAPGTPVESRRLLTNEGIVQMMRQGQAEASIIAAIRANPARFDVSLEKVLALHRQGVSTHILNAMAIAELSQRKAGGEKNADELPYPPKGALLSPGAQQSMLGTQANSPSGDGSKSALVRVVQRPAAAATNQGATAMSPTAVERNGSLGDGTVRASASGMPKAQKPALNGAGKTAITANQTAVTATAVMPKTSPGLMGTSQTMSAQGNVSSSTAVTQSARTVALAPQPATASSAPRTTNLAAMGRVPSQVNLQVAAECAKDPTARILYVTTGASTTTTFTPGVQYTIWGCSFGEANPSNMAVVVWGGGGLVGPGLDVGAAFVVGVLDLTSWSPNSIVVSVSHIGEAMPDNNNLVKVENAVLAVLPFGKPTVCLSGVTLQQ